MNVRTADVSSSSGGSGRLFETTVRLALLEQRFSEAATPPTTAQRVESGGRDRHDADGLAVVEPDRSGTAVDVLSPPYGRRQHHLPSFGH
jgi:hypothetical protein